MLVQWILSFCSLASIIPITKIYARKLTTITEIAMLSSNTAITCMVLASAYLLHRRPPWFGELIPTDPKRFRPTFFGAFYDPGASKTLANRQKRAIISALHMLREVVRFCFHDDDDERIITENQQIVGNGNQLESFICLLFPLCSPGLAFFFFF